MAFPSFLGNPNALAALLQSAGAGLTAYGSGNPQWGLLAANQIQDQQRFNQQSKLQRAQLDRQASQDAYELQQRQEADKRRAAAADALRGIVGGQPGTPNNGRPGGMGTPATPPAMGFDPTQAAILQAMSNYNPEAGMALVGQQAFEKQKIQEPYSPLAKLKDDLMHGRISQPEYDAALKKETWITPAAQTTVNVGPTGINYGDPEPGLAWIRNPDGTVKLDGRGLPMAGPYQGSKAYIAQQDAAASGAAKTQMAQQTARVVTDNVARIKQEMKGAVLPTTGTLGPVIAQIPGTSGNNVRAMLATIKANIGIDKLQQMRNASPTGGALGQVSEQENAMLQATMGNLEQSQTTDQFLHNLDEVNRQYDMIINGPTGTANGPKKNPSDMTDQEIMDELNK